MMCPVGCLTVASCICTQLLIIAKTNVLHIHWDPPEIPSQLLVWPQNKVYYSTTKSVYFSVTAASVLQSVLLMMHVILQACSVMVQLVSRSSIYKGEKVMDYIAIAMEGIATQKFFWQTKLVKFARQLLAAIRTGHYDSRATDGRAYVGISTSAERSNCCMQLIDSNSIIAKLFLVFSQLDFRAQLTFLLNQLIAQ